MGTRIQISSCMNEENSSYLQNVSYRLSVKMLQKHLKTCLRLYDNREELSESAINCVTNAKETFMNGPKENVSACIKEVNSMP